MEIFFKLILPIIFAAVTFGVAFYCCRKDEKNWLLTLISGFTAIVFMTLLMYATNELTKHQSRKVVTYYSVSIGD